MYESLKCKATEGQRSVLIFLVQQDDCQSFVVSNSHDPAYAKAFEDAVASGVEIIYLAVSVYRDRLWDTKTSSLRSKSDCINEHNPKRIGLLNNGIRSHRTDLLDTPTQNPTKFNM